MYRQLYTYIHTTNAFLPARRPSCTQEFLRPSDTEIEKRKYFWVPLCRTLQNNQKIVKEPIKMRLNYFPAVFFLNCDEHARLIKLMLSKFRKAT